MLIVLERSSGNVLGIQASGKLTHADHRRLVPRLEELIRKHRKVRVLLDLADCRGWEVGAAWDDLTFGLKHGGDVERCAVVGETKWQEWMTKLSRPFFNVRYFAEADLEKAWRWVLAEGHSGSAGSKEHRGVNLLSGLSNCQHA
jgi:hypothetical protein